MHPGTQSVPAVTTTNIQPARNARASFELVTADARPDSDYDVAIFLQSLPERLAELDRLASISLRERMLLMHEIRQEGLSCYSRDKPFSRQGAQAS